MVGTIFLLRIDCENEVFFIWSVIRTQYFRQTENGGKLQLTQRRVRLPFISLFINRMASTRVVVKQTEFTVLRFSFVVVSWISWKMLFTSNELQIQLNRTSNVPQLGLSLLESHQLTEIYDKTRDKTHQERGGIRIEHKLSR